MSEIIPEDVMKTAESVYAKLGRGSGPDTNTIARALMAERERMMAAIDDVCDGHGSDHDKIRFIRARIRNA